MRASALVHTAHFAKEMEAALMCGTRKWHHSKYATSI